MGKKLLLVIFGVLNFHFSTSAQWGIIDGYPEDSSIVTFDTMQVNSLVTDGSNLWQIGNTNKTYFIQGSTPVRSIMTDTINPYPINADSWFQITFNAGNTIVDFKHKYQTDSLHDGCLVEFSTDNGATWENVKGNCNHDVTSSWNGIFTSNLYAQTDTLTSGEMAFSGSSNGWLYSRVQFFIGLPVKSTDSTSWCNMSSPNINLRFRFLSDSSSEALDGWIIDSIKIEHDHYTGPYVKEIQKRNTLKVYPQPSNDGIIHFPDLDAEETYNMAIINSLGQKVLECNYQHELNLSMQPKGLYFYNVSNGTEHYTGKILLE